MDEPNPHYNYYNSFETFLVKPEESLLVIQFDHKSDCVMYVKNHAKIHGFRKFVIFV